MKLEDHLIVADRCRGTPAEKSIRELVERVESLGSRLDAVLHDSSKLMCDHIRLKAKLKQGEE